MPNALFHYKSGIIVGLGTTIILSKESHKDKIFLTKIAVGAGASILTARLPDFLEPAINPNHRAFFHSYAFAAIIGIGVVKLWIMFKKLSRVPIEKRDTPHYFKILFIMALIVCGIAILVHLIFDAFTSKGLPMI